VAYLITIGERPDFRVNAEDFKDQLRSGWPSVEFERVMVPNDPLILHWKIEIGDDIQLGALHSDKQTISIDGFPASVTKFVIWYRKNVPSLYQLFLSHDSSDEEVEILSDTTEDEILSALNRM